MHTLRNYHLDEASGLNSSLRASLPELSNLSVREEMKLMEMKKSMFSEVTVLEQRWNKIFACDNNSTKNNDHFCGVVC